MIAGRGHFDCRSLQLATALDWIELGTDQMTPLQRQVWERYKKQTAQFAEDMLLAEGDRNAIIRRLGFDSRKS
ncbi:hypothetical protein PCPL58_p2057 (plasmid) [Pseudomonas cerasi]|uniref:Uncharacterized protein n=2 Tax=Pseudomonas TaxID=286 RepID=A0A3M5SZS6_9PSED|nr:hypothetical protein ALP32_200249 [Pseudomonas avellanae]CZT26074.1 hypothetical protein PCPL58_p2057 [Pseudomonas cerasi]SOS30405.1 hypothetical protein PL963_P400033 [Pseudomonas cerasi]